MIPDRGRNPFFSNDLIFKLLHLQIIYKVLFVFFHVLSFCSWNFLLWYVYVFVWLFIQVASSLQARLFSPETYDGLHVAQVWWVQRLVINLFHIDGWPVNSWSKVMALLYIIVIKRLCSKLDCKVYPKWRHCSESHLSAHLVMCRRESLLVSDSAHISACLWWL